MIVQRERTPVGKGLKENKENRWWTQWRSKMEIENRNDSWQVERRQVWKGLKENRENRGMVDTDYEDEDWRDKKGRIDREKGDMKWSEGEHRKLHSVYIE